MKRRRWLVGRELVGSWYGDGKMQERGVPMGIFLPFSATGGAPGWNSAGSRLNASARCAATTEGAYMGAVTQPVPLYREVDGWLGGMRLFGASVRFYAHNAGSSAGGRNNCLPTSTRTRLGTQASYREHLYSRAVRSRGLSLLSLSLQKSRMGSIFYLGLSPACGKMFFIYCCPVKLNGRYEITQTLQKLAYIKV